MSTQISPLTGVPSQRVAFGTSGHHGSAFDVSFNEWHVLAVTQAICDYRKGQGITGPLFMGIDTHALSAPACASALEVLAANGVDVVLAASILRSRGEDRFYNYGATGLSGVAVGMDGGRSRQFYAHVSRAAWALDLVHGSRDKTDPTAAFFNDPLVPAFPSTDRYDLAQLQYQDAFADDSLAVSLTVQNLFGKHQAQPASDTNWQNALQQDGRNLRLQLDLRF